MVFHKVLGAALVVVPMALFPADSAGQERGSDRAQIARDDAPAMGRVSNASPRGFQNAFDGRTPPAALQRLWAALFSPPAAEEVLPDPEPAPAPEPAPVEECDTSFALVDGAFVMVDCHGTVVGAQ